ncbi:MAG: hypothetical protein JWO05_878 [Gemmatimonadetes bacterium]|nr:hypothetical protein [Gemmatimonadota bacterium]
MRTNSRRTLLAAAIAATAFVLPHAARAQLPASDRVVEVNRSGPRFGMTFLGGSLPDTIQKVFNLHSKPQAITQFGWQFERQFMSFEGGPTAVNEWVVLVGGMDQGLFIPSLSWIVGIRTPGNMELGVGPNASPAGVGMVLTAGVTQKFGAINVPFNLAVVPGRLGTRISIMTGFNVHH